MEKSESKSEEKTSPPRTIRDDIRKKWIESGSPEELLTLTEERQKCGPCGMNSAITNVQAIATHCNSIPHRIRMALYTKNVKRITELETEISESCKKEHQDVETRKDLFHFTKDINTLYVTCICSGHSRKLKYSNLSHLQSHCKSRDHKLWLTKHTKQEEIVDKKRPRDGDDIFDTMIEEMTIKLTNDPELQKEVFEEYLEKNSDAMQLVRNQAKHKIEQELKKRKENKE